MLEALRRGGRDDLTTIIHSFAKIDYARLAADDEDGIYHKDEDGRDAISRPGR
jgi:hypothetical protein